MNELRLPLNICIIQLTFRFSTKTIYVSDIRLPSSKFEIYIWKVQTLMRAIKMSLMAKHTFHRNFQLENIIIADEYLYLLNHHHLDYSKGPLCCVVTFWNELCPWEILASDRIKSIPIQVNRSRIKLNTNAIWFSFGLVLHKCSVNWNESWVCVDGSCIHNQFIRWTL